MSLTFEALYDEHASYVVRSLRRLGVSEADVLDEAQNAFVALHRHLGRFDSARPIKPWIFGFCHRIAANYRRLARNAHSSTALPENLESKDTPEREVDKKTARGIVLIGLQELDETLRSVFCMYELDGFTAPEIADVLEIPVASVYVQVKTARRQFRGALDAKGLP